MSDLIAATLGEAATAIEQLQLERDAWKEKAYEWAARADENISTWTRACHAAEQERDALHGALKGIADNCEAQDGVWARDYARSALKVAATLARPRTEGQ